MIDTVISRRSLGLTLRAEAAIPLAGQVGSAEGSVGSVVVDNRKRISSPPCSALHSVGVQGVLDRVLHLMRGETIWAPISI